MIHHLTSKAAYLFGFIAAIALFAVAGIIMMAIILLTNSDLGKKPTAVANTNAVAEDGGPVPIVQVDSVDPQSVRYLRGSGDLIFIEYTDLECPFCKTFHPTVNAAAQKYEGKIAFGFKHFPLNIHPKAKREAVAAECAGLQGQFFEFVDAIFAVTPSNNKLDDAVLFQTATDLHLNMDAFTDCVENEDTLPVVAEDAIEAQATGGTGTPHSVLIDKDGTIISAFRGVLTEQELSGALDQFLQ